MKKLEIHDGQIFGFCKEYKSKLYTKSRLILRGEWD